MSHWVPTSPQLLYKHVGTVTSAITHVSVTRNGYNAIDEQVNAICTTRTSANSCCLLSDFSDQCEDTRLDDRPIFLVWPYFLRDFLWHGVSQERNYHVKAELTIKFVVPQDCIPDTWVWSTTVSTVVLKSSINKCEQQLIIMGYLLAQP
jgi:hypothetical protein